MQLCRAVSRYIGRKANIEAEGRTESGACQRDETIKGAIPAPKNER